MLRRRELTSNRRQGVPGDTAFVCGSQRANALAHPTRGGRIVLAERDLLVDRAQPLHFGLESVDASLEVLVGLVKGDDVVGGCSERRVRMEI